MAEDPDTKQSREEFAAARRMLVDKMVADNPGLSHQDFNDVALADFDDHAKALSEQKHAADREAAARVMNMTPEEFDAFQADRQKQSDKQESTPQSRTANLPAGKASPTQLPPRGETATEAADEGAWGTNLIAQAAADDIREFERTGEWPKRNPAEDFGI